MVDEVVLAGVLQVGSGGALLEIDGTPALWCAAEGSIPFRLKIWPGQGWLMEPVDLIESES